MSSWGSFANPARRLGSYIARILLRYVVAVDEDALQMGLWAGDVVLRGLVVRTDALRLLKMPVVVRNGHIGSVQLQIPWRSFGNGRMGLTIEDLYLSLEPIGSAIYDENVEAAIRTIIRAQKQSLLAKAESLLEGAVPGSTWTSRLLRGLAGSFVSRALRGLRVELKNINVVWLAGMEGGLGAGEGKDPIDAVALCAHFRSFKLVPLVEISSVASSSVEKDVHLRDFAIYLRPAMGDEDEEDMKLGSGLGAPLPPSASYILNPLDVEGHVEVHLDRTKADEALIRAQIELGNVSVRATAEDYRVITAALAEIHAAQRRFRFRKYRPRVPVTLAPGCWWQFALRAVRAELEVSGASRCSWVTLLRKTRLRSQYMNLYRRLLLFGPAEEDGHEPERNQKLRGIREREDVGESDEGRDEDREQVEAFYDSQLDLGSFTRPIVTPQRPRGSDASNASSIMSRSMPLAEGSAHAQRERSRRAAASSVAKKLHQNTPIKRNRIVVASSKYTLESRQKLRLTPSDEDALLGLEDDLGVEELLLYRGVVRRRIEQEGSTSAISTSSWLPFFRGEPGATSGSPSSSLQELSAWTGISEDEFNQVARVVKGLEGGAGGSDASEDGDFPIITCSLVLEHVELRLFDASGSEILEVKALQLDFLSTVWALGGKTFEGSLSSVSGEGAGGERLIDLGNEADAALKVVVSAKQTTAQHSVSSVLMSLDVAREAGHTQRELQLLDIDVACTLGPASLRFDTGSLLSLASFASYGCAVVHTAILLPPPRTHEALRQLAAGRGAFRARDEAELAARSSRSVQLDIKGLSLELLDLPRATKAEPSTSVLVAVGPSFACCGNYFSDRVLAADSDIREQAQLCQGKAALESYYISVTGLALRVFERPGAALSVVRNWGGDVLITRCMIVGHPRYPHLRVKAILPPLNVIMSRVLASAYLAVYSTALSVRKVLHREADCRVDVHVPAPRLELLSSLTRLQLSVSLQELKVTVEDHCGPTEERAAIVRECLEKFSLAVMEYPKFDLTLFGDNTWVEGCERGPLASKRLLRTRLLSLGCRDVDIHAAASLLLKAHSGCECDDQGEALASEVLDEACKVALSQCLLGSDVPRLVLSVHGITLNMLKLTYDTRLDITATMARVVDARGFPLLSCCSRAHPPLESSISAPALEVTGQLSVAHRAQSYRRRSGAKAPVVSEDLGGPEDEHWLTLSIIQQDSSHAFGQGGHAPSMLSKATDLALSTKGTPAYTFLLGMIGPSLERGRETQLVAALGKTDASVDPLGLSPALLSIAEIISGALKLRSVQPVPKHGPSQKQLLTPVQSSAAMTMMVTLRQVNLLLSLSGRPISSLLVCGTHLDLEHIGPRGEGLPWQLRSVRVKVDHHKLFDLTPDGVVHAEVAVAGALSRGPSQGTHSEGMAALLLEYSPEINSDVLVTLHSTSLCLVSRFCRELSEYFGRWGLEPVIAAVKAVLAREAIPEMPPPVADDPGKVPSNTVRVNIHQLTVIAPRNTSSTEAAGLTVAQVIVNIGPHKGTWRLPSDPAPVSERRARRAAAAAANARHSENAEDMHSALGDAATRDDQVGPDFSLQSTLSSADLGIKYTALDRIPSGSSFSLNYQKSETDTANSSDDEFFDAPSAPLDDESSFGSKGSSSSFGDELPRAWAIDEDADGADDNLIYCRRIGIHLKGVCLLVALLPELEQTNDATGLAVGVSDQDEIAASEGMKRNWSCSGGARLYKSDYPKFAAMAWRELTIKPCDLLLLVDGGGGLSNPRTLLSMPEPEDGSQESPALALDISMAAYYLLLSTYYDNYCEIPTFFGELEPGYFEVPPLPTNWPLYGDPEMIRQTNAREPRWEFSLSVPILDALVSLETTYFPTQMPCLWMAEPEGEDGRPMLPAIRIRFVNTVVDISGGNGVLKIVTAAGELSAIDARDPAFTLYPVVLRAGQQRSPGDAPGGCAYIDPASTFQGFSCPDFGMKEHRGSVGEPLSQPVQVSIIMTTADQWCCVNVGVESPDACAKDMAAIWLAVDVFSWYHRDPNFGCPFYGYVPPGEAPPPGVDPIPPRSIDVRVWVTKPHIVLLEYPQSQRSSAVVVEATSGVYYRWQWFAIPEMVHMEANVQGLAVVVLNSYNDPQSMRGVRGAAGSGRGVRTLIEHMSARLDSNQWYAESRLDLYAAIPAEDDAMVSEHAAQYGFHGPPLEVDAGLLTVPEPRAVQPLGSIGRSFGGPGSGGGVIVTAYEDLVFAAASFVVFLGPRPEPTTLLPDTPGNGILVPGEDVLGGIDVLAEGDGELSDADRESLSGASQEEMLAHLDIARHFDDEEDDESFLDAEPTQEQYSIEKQASRGRLRRLKEGLGKLARGGSSGSNIGGDINDTDPPSSATVDGYEETPPLGDGDQPRPFTMTVAVIVKGLRIVLVDQVLGLHLPIVKVSLGTLTLMLENRLESEECALEEFIRRDDGLPRKHPPSADNSASRWRPSSGSSPHARSEDGSAVRRSVKFDLGLGARRSSSGDDAHSLNSTRILEDGTSVTGESSLQAPTASSTSVHARVWVDYFNNTLKCWESLIEPLSGWVMSEISSARGTGLVVRLHNSLHLNFSGALIETLMDMSERLELLSSQLNAEYFQDRISKLSALQGRPKVLPIPLNGSSQLPRGQHVLVERSVDEVDEDFSVPEADVRQSWQPGMSMSSIRGFAQHLYHGSGESSYGSPALQGRNSFDIMSQSQTSSRFSVRHLFVEPLPLEARMAFTVLNLTGEQIRYYQPRANDSTRRLQYLDHSVRGMLVFSASMTVLHDCRVVDVPFDLQREVASAGEAGVTLSTMGPNDDGSEAGTGHTFALQVNGYRWLPRVSADLLGIRALPLQALLGRLSGKALSPHPALKAAMSVIADVHPLNGGRQVTIRSVFRLLNSTDHDVVVLAKPDGTTPRGAMTSDAEILSSGQTYNFPVSLLQRAVEKSDGASLGFLWIKPRGEVEYLSTGTDGKRCEVHMSTVPVKLHQLATEVKHRSQHQVNCASRRQVEGRMLPPFTYCLEVRRKEVMLDDAGVPLESAPLAKNPPPVSPTARPLGSPTAAGRALSLRGIESTSVDGNRSRKGIFGRRRDKDFDAVSGWVTDYHLILHPPLVIENLLPHTAEFELTDQSMSMLWRVRLEPGASSGVYTVGMHAPLLLLVNLDFARSNEGVLVHDGQAWSAVSDSSPERATQPRERLKSRDNDRDTLELGSSIAVTDGVGQRLQLRIENRKGSGGQRHVSVYCPFWMVNTSHYALRFRQDGSKILPAGTVSRLGDGSRPIYVNGSEDGKSNNGNFSKCDKPGGAFAGLPGPMLAKWLGPDDNDTNPGVVPEQLLKEELSLVELAQYAFMFNFSDSTVLGFGEKRVCVQVEDSHWSKPFSLEGIGMSQVLSARHSSRGLLELGFNVTIPPGRLGQLTKVVQFWPRFVLKNWLPRRITLMQNVSLRMATKVVTSLREGGQQPFHLPQCGGERELRVYMGRSWYKSASFPIDGAGDYTLRLRRCLEWRDLTHIDTRGRPEYDELIPAGVTDIGMWLETDWYREQVVVQDIRPESYAYNHTDIQPGDVLLAINGTLTANLSFNDCLALLRSELASAAQVTTSTLGEHEGEGEGKCAESAIGTQLRFRTMEARYKLLRAKAMHRRHRSHTSRALPAGSVDDIGLGHTSASQHSRASYMDEPDFELAATSLRASHHRSPTTGTVDGPEVFDDELMILHEEADAKERLDSGVARVRSSTGLSDEESQEDVYVRIELRPMAASTVLTMTPMAPNEAPYVIENIDINHSLYFRQRGADGHPWNYLGPGQKCYYTWEEPMGSRRLAVRVGSEKAIAVGDVVQAKGRGIVNVLRGWGVGAVPSEADGLRTGPTKMLRIDEVGTEEKLILPEHEIGSEPGAAGHLHARVVAEGQSRILLVSCHKDIRKTIWALRKHRKLLEEQVTACSSVLLKYERYSDMAAAHERTISADAATPSVGMQTSLSAAGGNPRAINMEYLQTCERALGIDQKQVAAVSAAEERMRMELGAGAVTQENQLVVEILAARGLRPTDLDGHSSPYCVCYLKIPDLTRYKEFAHQRAQTYFVDKTLSPTWNNQRFVFKVPAEAVTSKRGFRLRVLVLSRQMLRLNDFLGQAEVPLSVLQDQRVRVGWFPLTRRSSRFMDLAAGDKISGSLKMRVRWIHSTHAFLEHRMLEMKGLHGHLQAMHDRAALLIAQLRREQTRNNKRRRLGMQITTSDEDGRGLRLRRRLERIGLLRELQNSPPMRSGRLFKDLGAGLGDVVDAQISLQPPGSDTKPQPGTARVTRPVSLQLGPHAHDQIKILSSRLQRGNDLDAPRPRAVSFTLGVEPSRRRSVYHTKQAAANAAARLSAGSNRQSLARVVEEALTADVPVASEDVIQRNLLMPQMVRPSIKDMLSPCRQAMICEMDLSHQHVVQVGGSILIRPLQALNLKETSRRIYVVLTTRLQAGLVRWQSDRAPAAIAPSWPTSMRACQFPVGALETNGMLNIEVFSEGGMTNLRGDTSLGTLEIPLSSLVDCCTFKGRNEFQRWFPLTAPLDDMSRLRLDSTAASSSLEPTISEQRSATAFPNHNPVVQMSVSWVPLSSGGAAERTRFYSLILMREVSVSLIDSTRSLELMRLSASGLDLRWAETKEYSRCSCVVRWLQADNQTLASSSRVVLAPTPVLIPQPTLQASMVRNNLKSHSRLEHYEYIGVLLQELDVKIEQAFVTDIVQFIADRLDDPRTTRLMKRRADAGEQTDPDDSEVGSHPDSIEDRFLYIDALQLQPIKLNLGFTKNADMKDVFRVLKQSSQNRTDREEEQGISAMGSEAKVNHSIVSNFPRLLAEFALNLTSDISPSPVKLNGMEISYLCKTQHQLITSLQSHYFGAILRQLYKIVGSFDFLGDPIGVLNQFGTGVRDFFYEPAEGLMQSPSAFGRGVAKGTLSLVGNTTSGILGFTTKITRSVGGGVAVLSMDEEFQSRRLRRERVRKGQGSASSSKFIKQAGYELANGVFHGVAGIVVDPYQGARRDGVRGFFFGVCQGVAGVATKPMVGCLDAITHTGEAAIEMASELAASRPLPDVQPKRLPQPFALDGRLVPYSHLSALGSQLLAQFPLKVNGDVALTAPSSPSTAANMVGSDVMFSMSDDEGDGDSLGVASLRQKKGVAFGADSARSQLATSGAPGSPSAAFQAFQGKWKSRKSCRERRDFIIWTEVLQQSPSAATILVVSNLRLLCLAAQMDGSRLALEVEWEVRFGSVRALPVLTDNGGGGLTLDFTNVMGGDSGVARRSRVENEVSVDRPHIALSRQVGRRLESVLSATDRGAPARIIAGDYRHRPGLIRVFNILSSVIRSGNDIAVLTPTTGALGAETSGDIISETNFLSINGWEFGDREQSERGISSNAARRQAVIWRPARYSLGARRLTSSLAFEMDTIQWRQSNKLPVSKRQLRWKMEMMGQIMAAPAAIPRLLAESEPSTRDSLLKMNLKERLRLGCITAEEFAATMDEVLRSELLDGGDHAMHGPRSCPAPPPEGLARSVSAGATHGSGAGGREGVVTSLRRGGWLVNTLKDKADRAIRLPWVSTTRHDLAADSRGGSSSSLPQLTSGSALPATLHRSALSAVGLLSNPTHSAMPDSPVPDSPLNEYVEGDGNGASLTDPLSAEDNFSSVSVSSAGVADLSARLERIEEAMKMLLTTGEDASKWESRVSWGETSGHVPQSIMESVADLNAVKRALSQLETSAVASSLSTINEVSAETQKEVNNDNEAEESAVSPPNDFELRGESDGEI